MIITSPHPPHTSSTSCPTFKLHIQGWRGGLLTNSTYCSLQGDPRLVPKPVLGGLKPRVILVLGHLALSSGSHAAYIYTHIHTLLKDYIWPGGGGACLLSQHLGGKGRRISEFEGSLQIDFQDSQSCNRENPVSENKTKAYLCIFF